MIGHESYVTYDRPGLIVEAREVYTTPRRCNMMRMTAITIRVWIQPPVRGKFGLMFRPRNPSSHRMTRITMIVHNMRFLLLNNLIPFSLEKGMYHQTDHLPDAGTIYFFRLASYSFMCLSISSSARWRV
jgi:hypothetical protein